MIAAWDGAHELAHFLAWRHRVFNIAAVAPAQWLSFGVCLPGCLDHLDALLDRTRFTCSRGLGAARARCCLEFVSAWAEAGCTLLLAALAFSIVSRHVGAWYGCRALTGYAALCAALAQLLITGRALLASVHFWTLGALLGCWTVRSRAVSTCTAPSPVRSLALGASLCASGCVWLVFCPTTRPPGADAASAGQVVDQETNWLHDCLACQNFWGRVSKPPSHSAPECKKRALLNACGALLHLLLAVSIQATKYLGPGVPRHGRF